MSTPNTPNMSTRERLLDLLCTMAIDGVSAEERREIDRLAALHPDVDLAHFSAPASAVWLERGSDRAALPEAVRARALAAAEPLMAGVAGRIDARGATWSRRSAPLAWLAAAAGIALAAIAWWPRLNAPPPVPVLTPDERMAILSKNAPDAKESAWEPFKDPLSQGVSGRVVWSDAKNEGYVRFAGLKSNDPKLAQYQLWIFDKDQDEKYPIDGGVFDIPAGAESATLAITPKIKVGKATMFAVTLERPGGVVVTTRERLIALAKVQ